jgi:integrase/recombinase XerD
MRSSRKSIRYKDAEIVELWLQSQASPHTRSCYKRDYQRLRAHVRTRLARITLADLHGFAQSLVAEGLAPISRARTIAATKSLFGFCQRMRFIGANPAAGLPLPRYEARLSERILGEGDVDKMLAADAAPRDRTLLQLIYAAGLRVSEACQLRWRNLRPNRDAGQITVFGKNGRTRSIALPAFVWSELISLRGEAAADDPVFPSRGGKPLDRGRVRRILREIAVEAGIADRVSPHWLRHAHASHALDHGAPLSLVRDTLGHASISTTSAYLHARPGDSSSRFLVVIGERANPAVSQEPKARQTATVAPRGRGVAPGGGKWAKDTTQVKKLAQSATSVARKAALP